VSKLWRAIAATLAITLAIAGLMTLRARSAVSTPPHPAANESKTSSPVVGARPGNASAASPTYAAAGTVTPTGGWIGQAYPNQAKASQSNDSPSTMYWALLIGINEYSGGTENNVGSRQDVESLAQYLVKAGWRTDHIITIKDRNATAAHIIDGIRWLASKTNSSSTVIFQYAGHENWTRTNSDGDSEGRDVEIWATNNRYIIDGTLGRELGRVQAARMWLDFATCRAQGFSDAGMIKPGRILTYSSPENEFSYEDPRLHHSVFGYFLIVEGILNRKADTSPHDGKVTVEEAFNYARPRVASYTRGAQHPVMIDKVPGTMLLIVPPKSKPKPSSSPSPSPSPSTGPKTCVVLCVG
jgi:hypothetical protein